MTGIKFLYLTGTDRLLKGDKKYSNGSWKDIPKSLYGCRAKDVIGTFRRAITVKIR